MNSQVNKNMNIRINRSEMEKIASTWLSEDVNFNFLTGKYEAVSGVTYDFTIGKDSIKIIRFKNKPCEV
jgi:hypothetical protein